MKRTASARAHTLAFALLALCAPAQAEPRVLPMRERAAVIDQWLGERVQTVLPGLMRRAGIDLWVLISREYNEDPVLRTFPPATWQSARRRTMLLIHDRGEGEPLETLAIARYDVGETFRKAWDKERDGDQWARLAELIAERDPKTFGVNVSNTFALADGMAHTEYRLLEEDAFFDGETVRYLDGRQRALWLIPRQDRPGD